MAFPQKFFEHEELSKVPSVVLKRIDTDQGRFYETPAGTFPSVTTVLGQKLDKSGLERWRADIGNDYANRVTTQAKNRGTALHALFEGYLSNDLRYASEAMPVNVESFSRIKPYLNQSVGKIWGVEWPLYSAQMKVAGTADLVAEWNGIPSVVDLKTARKLKKPDQLIGYFLQATCYGLMINEHRKEDFIRQTVILMVPDDAPVQIWVHPLEDYLAQTLATFQ